MVGRNSAVRDSVRSIIFDLHDQDSAVVARNSAVFDSARSTIFDLHDQDLAVEEMGWKRREVLDLFEAIRISDHALQLAHKNRISEKPEEQFPTQSLQPLLWMLGTELGFEYIGIKLTHLVRDVDWGNGIKSSQKKEKKKKKKSLQI